MSKKIVRIPKGDIVAIELVVSRCRKSMAQVGAEARKARPECKVYVLNGGMWNGDGSPCPLLRAQGVMLSKTPWGAYGYGWDTGPDITLREDYSNTQNFVSCTCLIGPWGPVDKPGYDPKGQGGRRGRSAMAEIEDDVLLYCSSDGGADTRTPEALRDELAAMGCKSAVMFDSGGSSMCDYDGSCLYGDGRKCHNYIVIYVRRDGGEKEEPVSSKLYTVTPTVGLNIRSGPGSGYSKTGAYPCGATVSVLEEKNGWARTDKGWVSTAYLRAVEEPKQAVTDNGVAIKQHTITQGRRNRPGGINPCRWITVHETGNPAKGADAAAHGNALDGAWGEVEQVSWHYTVDDHNIVQHLPDSETAYHAGDGAKGPGNATSIGIEICVNMDGDFEAAKHNAAALVRLLMERHGLTLDSVVQHNRWNGKDCPKTIRATPGGWEAFLGLCRGEEQPVATPLEEAVKKLAAEGYINSPAYWMGGEYSAENVQALIIKWAATLGG